MPERRHRKMHCYLAFFTEKMCAAYTHGNYRREGSGKSGTCQPHIHRKHENIVKHNVKQASNNRCQHGP